MRAIAQNSRKLFIIIFALIITAFIGLRINSAIRNLKPFISTLTPMIYHPLASYDDKMSIKYPVYYDFVSAVKSLTTKTSTVYIPNIRIPYGEIMWPISNNQICSALLYPRNILFFQQNSIEDLKEDSYIVITHGFPEVNIKSKEIYLINGRDIKTITGNYNPRNFNYSDNGLIKL